MVVYPGIDPGTVPYEGAVIASSLVDRTRPGNRTQSLCRVEALPSQLARRVCYF